ncbi:MAG: UPF0182 family protein [Bacillota bacterium]
MRRLLPTLIVILAVVLLAGGGSLAVLYTDALWFRTVGFSSVFWKSLSWEWLVGLVGGLLTGVFIYLNLLLAWSQARWGGPISVVGRDGGVFQAEPSRWSRFLWIPAAAAGAIGGLAVAPAWLDVQRFLHAVPFGVADPLFGRDVSFYVFRLPVYEDLYAYLFTLTLVTGLLVGLMYLLTGGAGLIRRSVALGPQARTHMTLLFSLLLALKAWGYRLDAFRLVYSPRGVAFGAGYADVHAQLPALRILLVLALLAAAGLAVNAYLRRGWLLWGLPVLVVVASLAVGSLYPALVQQFVVRPNELAKESPYIAMNIQYTQQAFDLTRVEEQDYPIRTDLSAEDVAANQDTLANVRLWDWQPLLATYAQLQEIRPYYDFKDVDIDRYPVEGQAGGVRIRQVMLSVREMNNARLPEQGRTWINQHLKYTHGYGLVASPANEFDQEGLPSFLVQDLPPRSAPGFEVTRPEVYFGETTDDYVLVGTSEKEFDYPMGDQNQEAVYQGRGGVHVGSLLTRAAFAVRLGSLNLLVSSAIDSESRVLIYRNIKDAVRRVTPFLRFDGDPYAVLDQGRVVWIQDAYTVSDRYPYSEPFRPVAQGQSGELGGANYVRNSVKITLDAYDGTLRYYLADPSDPVAASYQAIFPGLFRPLSEMPESLRAHLRYPEDLFTTQAQMYATYHMTVPEVFYNREDTWALAQQVHTQQGDRRPMDPYYTVLRLPGEPQAEFVLMVPFTPGSRPNMISWLVARSDGQNYGGLRIYRLPKQQTVYGPMQVEGRIDGDTTISQNLTLWSQSGSEVIRGNLLVVPIKDSVLYVEPLYLQATNNRLPELKRVIVAYSDRVVMETTLGAALTRIFGESPNLPPPGPAVPPTGPGPSPGAPGPGAPDQPAAPGSAAGLIQEANRLYSEAQDLLRQGDWAGYGDRMRRLGDLLQQLQAQTGGATQSGTPARPTP